MEESDEDENVFAIPDLWKPSLFEPPQVKISSLHIENWDAVNYGIDLGQNFRFEGDSIFHSSSQYVALDLPDLSSDLGQEFRFEGDSIFKSSHCLALDLPGLSNFGYGPLETPATVGSPFYESTDDSTEDMEFVEEDPWSDANLWIQSDRPSKFKSWEIFFDKSFKEPRTAYMSEGGPLAFDAALRLHPHGTENSLNKRNGPVVKSTPMLRVRNTTHCC